MKIIFHSGAKLEWKETPGMLRIRVRYWRSLSFSACSMLREERMSVTNATNRGWPGVSILPMATRMGSTAPSLWRPSSSRPLSRMRAVPVSR